MANNPQITNAAASVAADAVLALVNTGYLRLYDAPQPATADTAISTQTLLAPRRAAPVAPRPVRPQPVQRPSIVGAGAVRVSGPSISGTGFINDDDLVLELAA